MKKWKIWVRKSIDIQKLRLLQLRQMKLRQRLKFLAAWLIKRKPQSLQLKQMRQKLEQKSNQSVLMLKIFIKLNQNILNKEKQMLRVYHYQRQNKLHMMHFMMFLLQPRKMRLRQKLKCLVVWLLKKKFQLLQLRKMRLRQKLKYSVAWLKKKKFQLLQPRKMRQRQKLKYSVVWLLKRKLQKFQLLLPRKMKLRQKPMFLVVYLKRSIIIISIIRKSIKKLQKFQLLQPRKMRLKQKLKSYPD